MKIFTIPNFITLGNLLCGVFGIISVFDQDLKTAGILIFIALVLDFFDGFVARLLKSPSEIGKELDSLADVVSFGVLPALIIYMMLDRGVQIFPNQSYGALIIALASALRLAKFNVDTRQSESFIGVPTPSNGMIVASFPFIIESGTFLQSWVAQPWVLIVYILVMSILLNSEIPLFALKFKNFSWKDNGFKFVFLGLSAVALAILRLEAVPLIILSYVGLSMFRNIQSKKTSD
ncbi:MAG: CDP-diacylglycerol--serine O-phosphatidyltransferase [Leadbetterella sp.]